MKTFYYIQLVFVANATNTDWPNIGHYSPVTPSMQKQNKNKKKLVILMNNLLTSNIQPLGENLKQQPCSTNLAIAWSLQQGLG